MAACHPHLMRKRLAAAAARLAFRVRGSTRTSVPETTDSSTAAQDQKSRPWHAENRQPLPPVPPAQQLPRPTSRSRARRVLKASVISTIVGLFLVQYQTIQPDGDGSADGIGILVVVGELLVVLGPACAVVSGSILVWQSFRRQHWK